MELVQGFEKLKGRKDIVHFVTHGNFAVLVPWQLNGTSAAACPL